MAKVLISYVLISLFVHLFRRHSWIVCGWKSTEIQQKWDRVEPVTKFQINNQFLNQQSVNWNLYWMNELTPCRSTGHSDVCLIFTIHFECFTNNVYFPNCNVTIPLSSPVVSRRYGMESGKYHYIFLLVVYRAIQCARLKTLQPTAFWDRKQGWPSSLTPHLCLIWNVETTCGWLTAGAWTDIYCEKRTLKVWARLWRDFHVHHNIYTLYWSLEIMLNSQYHFHMIRGRSKKKYWCTEYYQSAFMVKFRITFIWTIRMNLNENEK